MPYYDLRCAECGQTSTIKATVQQRSERQIACPACGSHDLATIYRQVNILRFKGKDCDVCPGSARPVQGGCCGGQCSFKS